MAKYDLDFIVDLERLADNLACDVSEEDLLQFIADIDLARCDWQFTEQIYQWAKKQHKIYKSEIAGE